MTTPGVLDLDAARAERAKARAAKNEGSGVTLPIVFGGQKIAELDAEFPISVLDPITGLDADLGFIIKRVTQAAQAKDRDQAIETAKLIGDLIVVNPDLPAGLVTAAKEIAKRALGGDEAYAAFTAQNPSVWDIRALAVGIMNWYGLSLGDFSPPSTSPGADGGKTSKPTSAASTTASTRAVSGKRPVKKASSGSGTSSA